MSIELRLLLGVVSIVFFCFVLLRVKQGKLLLPYSFVWLIIAILGIVAAVFAEWVSLVAHFCGFETASNFVFFLVMLFALVFLFFLSIVISKQTVRIKSLVQELALLKGEASRSERSEK